MPGTLYVVATPIGNLEDITLRALRVLGEVTLIAAEDTRTTRKLLARYDIHTPLTSLHAHTEAGKIAALVDRLHAGEDLAVVSEAGTPGISDPGEALVRAAVAAGVRVLPVPGPSALVAALSVGGLPVVRFVFEGFLPRTPAERRRRLAALRDDTRAAVFYESPRRLAITLRELYEVLGNRPAVVARELTKQFEEVRRGHLGELVDAFAMPVRGEVVIIVAGAAEAAPPASPQRVTTRVAELLQEGLSPSAAARQAAEEMGVSRREAYAAALRQRSGEQAEE
ncbi:MAG: 16S rRNA (cytidine(1402)-2'-O)-methyltransferase [Armatimonadetes bacterium]|nr:16S rRNA (cytidine(1402)-2'-O)-methyltransferase [Armatimonadota bacterium]